MKTTLTIDDKLLDEAKVLTKISEPKRLFKFAVEKMMAYEAAKRLSELGGTEPNIRVVSDYEYDEE